MTPVTAEAARAEAMAALAKVRSNDHERLNALALIDAMILAYQAQILTCTDAEALVIRVAARQLLRIRSGLTEKEIKAVGLFLP